MKKITAFGLVDRADLVSASGYAAEHVNQNSYRRKAISSISIGGTIYQAIVFWNGAGKLVIGTRIIDGDWTLYTTTISITGGDNHLVASLGIDPDGYIHVCYDMHTSALKYRKSDLPINSWSGTLTAPLSMLGTNEASVTYPTFFNDPNGGLYFIFRDGGAGNGDLYFYSYDSGSTSWGVPTGTSTGGKLIDGKSASPTRSPYWESPCFDSNFGSGGYLHISWHWRVNGDAAGANRDLSYVKWDGSGFKKSDGTSQTVPITSANQEIVDNTGGANLGLTSFNALYSDSLGHPHIVYPKAASYRYLYHAYHNGSNWAISQLTSTPNVIVGDETSWDIGLVPCAFIDRDSDTLYILYQDLMDIPGLILLKSSDFSSWSKKVLYPYRTGWDRPKIDGEEFRREKKVYLILEEYYGALLSGQQTSFPIYVWKVPSTLL